MQTKKIGGTPQRHAGHRYPENKGHQTGEALVRYIRQFDYLNGLKGGNTYIIGGKEVVI